MEKNFFGSINRLTVIAILGVSSLNACSSEAPVPRAPKTEISSSTSEVTQPTLPGGNGEDETLESCQAKYGKNIPENPPGGFVEIDENGKCLVATP